MITKESVQESLKVNIGQGKEDLTAIQHTFQELLDVYPDNSSYEDKKTVLDGVMFFAGELFGKVYGYREFDLIMGRAFPTAETFRGISEEEGRNLYA